MEENNHIGVVGEGFACATKSKKKVIFVDSAEEIKTDEVRKQIEENPGCVVVVHAKPDFQPRKHLGEIEETLILKNTYDGMGDFGRYGRTTKAQRNAVIVPVREGEKIQRNQPCPCGSGKKYKHCCGN